MAFFRLFYFCSFFTDTAPPELYTLSLHDALPIWTTAAVTSGPGRKDADPSMAQLGAYGSRPSRRARAHSACSLRDRKSTRLNSSHLVISYAVFCLKKKKKTKAQQRPTTYTAHSHE